MDEDVSTELVVRINHPEKFTLRDDGLVEKLAIGSVEIQINIQIKSNNFFLGNCIIWF
jgi:hypothetical protein